MSPTISHDPLNRKDLEASIDIRPPALERDFELPVWHRELRHVIEPELNYRFVGGNRRAGPNVLLFDTTDIATDVNEARLLADATVLSAAHRVKAVRRRSERNADDGTQRAMRRRHEQPAPAQRSARVGELGDCAGVLHRSQLWRRAHSRAGATSSTSTLDLMAPTFLTSPRNIAPIVSRMRFEAIDNLRVQWDLDYDTIAGNWLRTISSPATALAAPRWASATRC